MTNSVQRRPILAIVGASSGNLVEWYDFYAYSFTSLYFASAFFPAGDRTTQLLNTAGIFAAGFLMRPIGGWLFGRIADRFGRRTSMMTSVLMMCAGSLMVAVLPTYASVGATAPVLLLVARLVQGLSVGGEYGTSATDVRAEFIWMNPEVGDAGTFGGDDGIGVPDTHGAHRADE